MQYVLFNKPYGVLCQFTDSKGRQTLKDFIKIPHVYAAGRLDFDSEGLLFLTDDGKLNHLISHPDHKQIKTYWAQVERIPTEEQLAKLRSGVPIKGKLSLPAEARVIDAPKNLWERPNPIRERKSVPTTWLEIKIQEGQKHQVRKMTAGAGLPCLRLIRAAIGPMELGDLTPGEYRLIEKPKL